MALGLAVAGWCELHGQLSAAQERALVNLQERLGVAPESAVAAGWLPVLHRWLDDDSPSLGVQGQGGALALLQMPCDRGMTARQWLGLVQAGLSAAPPAPGTPAPVDPMACERLWLTSVDDNLAPQDRPPWPMQLPLDRVGPACLRVRLNLALVAPTAVKLVLAALPWACLSMAQQSNAGPGDIDLIGTDRPARPALGHPRGVFVPARTDRYPGCGIGTCAGAAQA